jgi:mRNA interferase RelE/StbE
VAKKEVWEIDLTRPAEKVYDKASKSIRERLDECFEDLEQNPSHGSNIKALTGNLKGLYRCRVGDWRVIYRLKPEHRIVEIIAILPRGDAKQGWLPKKSWAVINRKLSPSEVSKEFPEE